MKQTVFNLSALLRFPDPTFIRYCLIGVINTLCCFLVIFVLMSIFRVNYLVSNIVGYATGIMVSFMLNKYRNFRSRGTIRTELPFFLAAFGCSYSVNLFILWFAGEVLHADKFLSQLVSGAIYTIIFYFFMRSIVFARR